MRAAVLARRIFESRSNPKTLTFQDVWGRGLDLDLEPLPLTSAGKAVTMESALQVSAVYACVSLLADAVATLPLATFTIRRDGLTTPYRKPSWLEFRATNHTKIDFLTATMSSLLLAGNAYWLVFRDGDGMITRLEVADPAIIKVRRDSPGRPPRYFSGATELIYGMDVFHIRGFLLPGEDTGCSPIKHARETIGAALAVNEYGAAFFGNGALPGMVVEAPVAMSEAAVKIMRSSWNAMHKGSGNAAKLAVLTEGAKASKISVSPDEAQFLGTKGFMVTDIARLFRVPPHLIGDASGSTSWGSGLHQQNIAFAQHSLRPWIERIEEGLTTLMHLEGRPKNTIARLNVDGLMRGDYASRYTVYGSAVRDGILTINEVRQWEDLQPVPWGDVPVSVQVQQQEANAEPAAEAPAEPEQPTEAMTARAVAELVQKIYLGVGTVLTAEEARIIANRAGAGLPIPGPLDGAEAAQPAPPAQDDQTTSSDDEGSQQ